MTQTVEAVFENGVFRPLEPPPVVLLDGQLVRLTVETNKTPDDVLSSAAQVYAGLSSEEINEIERIAVSSGKNDDQIEPQAKG